MKPNAIHNFPISFTSLSNIALYTLNEMENRLCKCIRAVYKMFFLFKNLFFFTFGKCIEITIGCVHTRVHN